MDVVRLAKQIRSTRKVNALVAMRLAHGWTAQDVIDRWNACWPDDPKKARNLWYWENHDNHNGWPPTPLIVRRLADLYGCTPIDLDFEDDHFIQLPDSNDGRVCTGCGRPVPTA